MDEDDEKHGLSRRDLNALLGVLGGAVGLSTLAACAKMADASQDDSGLPAQTLTKPSFLWVDTIATLSVADGGPDGRAGSGTSLRGIVGAVSNSAGAHVANPAGYWTRTDGGGGIFYWSTTCSVGRMMAGTLHRFQPGTGRQIRVPVGRGSTRANWIVWPGLVPNLTTKDGQKATSIPRC